MTGVSRTIHLFDTFALTVPPELEWQQDGLPGKRVLFLSDQAETFLVSFEEGMKSMDLCSDVSEYSNGKSLEYRCDEAYIHQWRSREQMLSKGNIFAFFHFELQDQHGQVWHLPGQMTAKPGYRWSDGVEPILIELLHAFAAQEMGTSQPCCT